MISTLSMRFPCRDDKPPPLIPTMVDGFPSTRMRTFSLPRRRTDPSPSTCTEGRLPRISEAVAPLLAKSVPTLKMRLSKANSMLAFWPFTVTSSRVLEEVLMLILPSAMVLDSLEMRIFACLYASNPTLSMMIS